ncbi:cytochrome P450 [Kitasatospora viridis]|uniref:Cytochrome P450 n=1 Tax=Kitasatospora viridis TaxID=281105 RepID=A0A561UCE0_9ACTN|nr:cytochrome P450 [Kitasatospora viridis]TWF97034.1 cytochrome P450 [Kitasatospora viridis]
MTVESQAPDLPGLPMVRLSPLAEPPQYAGLREQAPISRHRWPNGVEAWLVTRYQDVRALLGDPRVSVNRFQAMPPSLSVGRKSTVMLPKSLIGMDPPEHTTRRRLYMRELTVRQVERLRPRIGQIVDQHLDELLAAGRTADLVRQFALPIPSLVIAELLGVPAEERAEFQRHTQTILGVDTPAEEVQRATTALMDCLRALVRLRRDEPGEDILSRLGASEVDGAPLTEDELVGHAMLLLIAGHETTANMLALGVATLLGATEAPGPLTADPERLEQVVEELLRFHAVIQFGLVRRAAEDIEIAGVTIRAGEWLVCSLVSANRDAGLCPHAERFDPERSGAKHLSFGYGIHQCAGQNLARLELRIALARLFARLPGLRLAQPLETLPFRADAWVYGLYELPVRW